MYKENKNKKKPGQKPHQNRHDWQIGPVRGDPVRRSRRPDRSGQKHAKSGVESQGRVPHRSGSNFTRHVSYIFVLACDFCSAQIKTKDFWIKSVLLEYS